MRKRAFELGLILLAVWLSPAPAAAEPVQWEIRGTVIEITGDAAILEGRFAAGTPWTGTVGWDTDLEDVHPGSADGEFLPQPGMRGPFLSLSLDGETFIADPADKAYSVEFEDPWDPCYSCLEIVIVDASASSIESSLPAGPGSFEIDQMNFQLWARGNRDALQGTALPAELDLDEFSGTYDTRIVSLYFKRGSTRAFVYGTIDSLTPLPAPPLELEVDIKPGWDVNRINPLGGGVIRVAILGTETFDIVDVDPSTLTFGPGEAQPVRPVDGRMTDVNGDEVNDLVLHFRTQDASIALGDTEACIQGGLFDATPIEGCDEIVTVPACGLGFELVLLLPPLMAAYHWRRQVRPVPSRRSGRSDG